MKNCFLIVNFNDYKSTKHLVDNINDFSCLEEIVIVDNSSDTEERKLTLSLETKHIHVIQNSSNVGYSAAINIGAEYLINKYENCNLIISNSDIVILSENDLEKMITYLNDPAIGLVGPQVLEKGHILRGRKDCSVNHDICNNLPFFKYFAPDNRLDYPASYYEGDYSKVDVVSTCFFLISSDTFKKINYMDENVFLYYEDFIMCNKVRNLGLDIIICNNIKIKHLYSISVDKNYKTSSKKKMLKESMLYYHSTYHNINFIQKSLLNFIIDLDIVLGKKR